MLVKDTQVFLFLNVDNFFYYIFNQIGNARDYISLEKQKYLELFTNGLTSLFHC